MSLSRILACLSALIFLGPAAVRAATPPALVNYQGVLRSAADAPLSGSYDMIFRLYSAAVGGDEILVDTHTSGVGAPVTVSGGLFSVAIGGGSVGDGSGPGSYTSLADVFRDYGTVYLAVQVGTESLTPRTAIASAAFALNASNLGGRGPGSYLDTSATAQSKSATLTLDASAVSGSSGLDSKGNVTGGHFKTSGAGEIFAGHGDTGLDAYGSYAGGIFRHGSTSSYDSETYLADATFGVRARGATFGGYFEPATLTSFAYLGVDHYGVFGQGDLYGGLFKDTSGATAAYLAQKYWDGSEYVEIGANLISPDYGLFVKGGMGSIDAEGYFGMSSRAAWIAGSFQNTSAGASGSATLAYSNTGVTGWGTWTGCEDCDAGGQFFDEHYSGYAALGIGDVGVLGYGNYSGGFFRHSAGGSTDNWAKVAEATYKITGQGSMGFVQNDPTDAGRVIVYNAPEGNEVATYTRGSARLVDGEARVALDPTFAWTTNPSLGLTVHVTPVGAASSLYVASKSTREIVVKSADAKNAEFDYVVYGLRIGFESTSIVQEKDLDAFIPPMTFHEEQYRLHPELRTYSAAARFEAIEASLGRTATADAPAAQALESSIGVFDPARPSTGGTLLTREHQVDFEARVARGEIQRASGPPESRGPRSSRASSRRPAAGAPQSSERLPAARSAVTPADRPARRDPIPAPDRVVFDVPPITVGEPVEPGDVLSNDRSHPGRGMLAAAPADRGMLGIVAGRPGESFADEARLAVAGTVVACKVDASSAPIEIDDLLVASPTPGHAMRAGESPAQGTVVGKALETLAAGTGVIRVLVMSR